MITRSLTLVLCAATGLAIVAAQQGVTDPATRKICESVGAVQLPAADRPTADDRAALSGCVALDLYFGFGSRPDPVRARKCAYLEMEQDEASPRPPSAFNDAFRGATMLMMAYANGKGAERNFDAALKLACAIGGAPQDVAGRVNQLARLKQGNWTGDRFSICDHSSGRFLYEQCAILQDRFDAVDRAQKLAAVMKRWTAAERAAFGPLRQAADRFFDAHARKEANLLATVEVQERAFQENQLISALDRFDGGETPRSSADELREAQAAMDGALKTIQEGTRRTWGTVTVDGITETQPLWIAYRDAWVAFGKKKYPAVTAASWQAWLTRERADSLSRFDQ